MFYNITDSLAIPVSYYIVLINIRTVILYHLMFNIKKYISSLLLYDIQYIYHIIYKYIYMFLFQSSRSTYHKSTAYEQK